MNVVSRVVVDSVESIHTGACSTEEFGISFGMLESMSNGLRWMFYKTIPVGNIRWCFVNVLVGLEDKPDG